MNFWWHINANYSHFLWLLKLLFIFKIDTEGITFPLFIIPHGFAANFWQLTGQLPSAHTFIYSEQINAMGNFFFLSKWRLQQRKNKYLSFRWSGKRNYLIAFKSLDRYKNSSSELRTCSRKRAMGKLWDTLLTLISRSPLDSSSCILLHAIC